MNRIIQLDPILSNQIAAGEVIERPASVVKELVENSIDAGADKIEIEIEGGGMHLIRVRDNGGGILKSDLGLAFSRHATSKIRHVSDLGAIQSLGFRGEALASIASVSHCRLVSRTQEEVDAWQIQIAPDLEYTITPSAHPVGTTIEVADLFYNTPVRRKFLRSEKTEFQVIDELVKRFALAEPQITFKLKHQQREIRFYSKIVRKVDEAMRVSKVCGQQFIEKAIAISAESLGLGLTGWLGLPSLGRRQADCQVFFVNKRVIKDRLLNHVIKSLYQQHPEYIEGTYPCYVLHLKIAPQDVDVNVHPTKQEVRFGEPRLVHDFMAKGIEQALSKISEQPDLPKIPKTLFAEKEKLVFHEKNSDKIQTSSRYALIEQPQGITLVLLEQVKASLIAFYYNKNNCIPMMPLLFPLHFTLIRRYPISQKMSETLEKIGFCVRFHGDYQLLLVQQPRILNQAPSEKLINALVKLISEDDGSLFFTEKLSKLLAEEFVNLPSALLELLPDWVAEQEVGPFLHLKNEQIASLMLKQHETI